VGFSKEHVSFFGPEGIVGRPEESEAEGDEEEEDRGKSYKEEEASSE
jgi:hypothetical protein